MLLWFKVMKMGHCASHQSCHNVQTALWYGMGPDCKQPVARSELWLIPCTVTFGHVNFDLGRSLWRKGSDSFSLRTAFSKSLPGKIDVDQCTFKIDPEGKKAGWAQSQFHMGEYTVNVYTVNIFKYISINIYDRWWDDVQPRHERYAEVKS